MAHVIPQRGGSLLYKVARFAQITIHQLSRPSWLWGDRRVSDSVFFKSRPQENSLDPGPLRFGRSRRVIFGATCSASHSRHATSLRCFDFSFGLRDCNTIELLDGWLEIRTRRFRKWRVFVRQLNEESIGTISSRQHDQIDFFELAVRLFFFANRKCLRDYALYCMPA